MEVVKDRKFLQTLQVDATDKENLVGTGRTPGKQGFKDDFKMKGEVGKKISDKVEPYKRALETIKSNGDNVNKVAKETKVLHKEQSVQTGSNENITIEASDLTSEAGPSENYWKILAERRRVDLQETLRENEELHEKVKRLEEASRIYKEMLDESRALVEVLQEMIGEDGSGINNSLDDSVL